VEAVVDEERRHSGGILRSIVQRGEEDRKSRSVRGCRIFECTFPEFDYSFCLTVRLRLVCGRLAGTEFENRREGRPEMRRGNGSAIGSDGIREAVEANNVSDKQLCQLRGRSGH
jgi:hypothetical protein